MLDKERFLELVTAFATQPDQERLDAIGQAASSDDAGIVEMNFMLSVTSIMTRKGVTGLRLDSVRSSMNALVAQTRWAHVVCRVCAVALLCGDKELQDVCVARLEGGGFTRKSDEEL